MRLLLLLTSLAFLSCSTFQTQKAESHQPFHVTIDLNAIKNDQINVSFQSIQLHQDTVVFHLPAIIPGTYKIYNFGRFVTEFSARDKQHNKLVVNRLDINSWQIVNAKKLSSIDYWVHDTWEKIDTLPQVFEPAGTSFQADTLFLLNKGTVVGYFKNMSKYPYQLTVKKSEKMYGATSLKRVSTEKMKDQFSATTYDELVDSPIFYTIPDTASIQVGNARVLISLYSTSKNISAKEILTSTQSIMEAAKNHLGGELPVDQYAILIYLDHGDSPSGGTGALEHSQSTVFYLPELPAQQISKMIRDVTAHEFYHIITPLTIHSEEIGSFDFNQPKMSKHLWLYEGVTDYTAYHVQIREGLLTFQQGLDEFVQKIKVAQQFEQNVSFTELSLGALDQHKDLYSNVYFKGTLIGWALDLELRKVTNGKYGIKDLLFDLSKKYGKEKSFKDDELFDEITSMTHPSIRDFFRNHVEGTVPLDYKKLFNSIGVNYETEQISKDFSFGSVALNYNPESKRLFVMNIAGMNDFGKEMGYQVGDEIYTFNGQDVKPQNFNSLFDQWKNSVAEGDELSIGIKRNGEMMELKSKVRKANVKKTHIVSINPNPTQEQLALRNSWIGKSK